MLNHTQSTVNVMFEMDTLIVCGIMSGIGISWGLILAGAACIGECYDEAKKLLRFGIGMAIAGPIAIIIGGFLLEVMV